MHVRILVLMVVGQGLGFVEGGCARAPVSFLSVVPDVPDDEDDACMDGVKSGNSGVRESCNCMFISGCSA